MRALIAGCGEAFDGRYPNTSVLVRTGAATVLFDCGYSVPPQVWAEVRDANEIDVVYISHAHADHYFGMPALLGRMWEDGRTKPLVVLSQPAVLDHIRGALELGYRGLSGRFQYEIDYRPADPGASAEAYGCRFDFAQTQHSVTNFAIRMRTGGKTFCYSGDGMFTDASRRLFTGADLLVHEAYWFEPSPVHADIGSLIGMACEQSVRRLALVHVQRGLRHSEPARIRSAMARATPATQISLPEPGALFEI